MKNINALFYLLLLTLTLAGCKEDKDPEPPTKEQMLMAKNWNPTAIKASGTVAGSLLSIDYLAQLNACQKDNFLKFETAGKVIMDEGPLKCNPNAPQTVQGTWSLNGNVLTIQGDVLKAFGLTSNTATALTIQELTAQTLKVTTTQPIVYSGFPVNATFDITFTGQ